MASRRQAEDREDQPAQGEAARAPQTEPPAQGLTRGAVLALQSSAGNVATRAMLQRAALSPIEKEKNLGSPAFAGDRQLEDAFDESPKLGRGARGEGVAKVQTALKDKGYELP